MNPSLYQILRSNCDIRSTIGMSAHTMLPIGLRAIFMILREAVGTILGGDAGVLD